jgi:putative membrane protein
MRKLKRFLSHEEQHAISLAVKEAEARSSSEIVPVVVLRSSRYDWIGYRAAIIGWAVASVVALWFYYFRPFMVDLWDIEALQLAGLLLGWVLSRFPFGVRWLVPEHTLALEVDHAAHTAFMHHGLMNTKERNGILIYVSLRERRVLILADRGVHEKVGQEYWKSEVARIVAGIREGRPAEGIVAAVRSIGEKLGVQPVR